MKLLIAVLVLNLMISCSSLSKKSDPFIGKRGCFLLYNLKTHTIEKRIGETCDERFPACSSFKVPLAVMAFDSGILKDEKKILKWDGQKRMLDSWNKNHNAATWMRDSVVWFSQRLTPMLGEKKLQGYLVKFNYGNQNIKPGITTAWLNSPNDPNGSLAINAYEQLDFIKKLWSNDLPVSKESMELTRQITYLETSPKGFRLSGKTGSSFYDKAHKIQFGWFIAHIGNGEEEYTAVTNFSDIEPVETTYFGGFRAKEITKTMLKEAGLW